MRLFDSRTQRIADLVPVHPGRVGMYVCGPTVQSAPHIGHLRSALNYDLLRRWLTFSGYDVTLIRNVTDIDDKILLNAVEEGDEWWALAYRVELQFSSAYRALGILPPTYEPRATGYIPEMQQLIATLIERGHAYAAEDGSGDVYFDTRSWPAYGELTRQRIDDMEPAADSDTRGKRDSRDFALWKGHKPDEPESASWSSPWGPGRPGWHIECSAMSTALLGDEFDIHGGGLDLRFPHHENELAQSSAAGQPFARLWIHNGLVAVGDQKMSKSLGNFILADDLLRSAPALAIRYCLGSAHYRSSLEFQPGSLTEAAAAVERLHSFLVRAKRRLAGTRFEVEEPIAHVVPDEFADAMNDDLGVPAALAVLHEAVRRGNALLDAESLDEVADTTVAVESMMSVLGLLNEPNADDRDLEGLGAALDELVRQRIDSRNRARGAKQYDVADSIRDELKQAGIILSDDASGTQWSLDG